MSDSAILVRRATLADRKGVLAIDHMLYDGLDYMIALYTTILQNKDFRSYVAESTDGDIVGFVSMMVDAEEKFCCILARRTKRQFQGQGINHMLKTQALSDLYTEFGENFNQLTVAVDNQETVTQEFWSDADRQFLLRYVFLIYIASYSRIVDVVTACRNSPRIGAVAVKELGLEKAIQVMTNEYTLQHLFRSSHFIALCNNLAFPKSLKYIRRIASESNVFASFQTGSSTQPSGVSYSSIIRGPLYVHINISLIVYNHMDILIAHLASHLAHVTKVISPEISVAIRIRFPTEIDKEAVKAFLLPTLGMNRIGEFHPSEYMMVWKVLGTKASI